MKVLVCVLGTIRGGDTAWKSLIKHVVEPLHADLALMSPNTAQKTILHEKAKFDWSLDDPENWGLELNRICNECGIEETAWHSSARRTSYEGLWGPGLLDGKLLKGSGTLIMLLKYMLLERLSVLKQYDKIIITRSDQLYFFDHPVPTSNDIDIPVGEDWWGIGDRHHVVDTSKIESYLCIAKWWMQNLDLVEKSIENHHNPEQVWALYIKHMGFRVHRSVRCMVTVSLKDDDTRWMVGTVPVPGYDDLFLKYTNEYYHNLETNSENYCDPLPSYDRYAIVVARYQEDIRWLSYLGRNPEWDVFVYNDGPSLDPYFTPNFTIYEGDHVPAEASKYLQFMCDNYHTIHKYKWIVFTQADPFIHSPDFIGLLESKEYWKAPFQGLTNGAFPPPWAGVNSLREVSNNSINGFRVWHDPVLRNDWTCSHEQVCDLSLPWRYAASVDEFFKYYNAKRGKMEKHFCACFATTPDAILNQSFETWNKLHVAARRNFEVINAPCVWQGFVHTPNVFKLTTLEKKQNKKYRKKINVGKVMALLIEHAWLPLLTTQSLKAHD